MKLAIVGYGKMGKAIAEYAKQRGHEIVKVIDQDNASELASLTGDEIEVAIEFTQPESAFANISQLLKNNIPVVSGTTGWLDRMPEIESLCRKHQGTFFYASNYSIGVNLFFQLNRKLARLMSGHTQYRASLSETHHIHKKDAPSGTAISLAEGITKNHPGYDKWVLGEPGGDRDLPITAVREGEVPGTHSVSYTSGVDRITITHEAFDRMAFVEGVVAVAEWLPEHKGMLKMYDFLQSSG